MKKTYSTIALIFVFVCFFSGPSSSGELPEGFVNIEEAVPGIVVELRYFTNDNFIGKRIDGYSRPRCYITREGAMAVKNVLEDLKKFGLGR